MTAPRWVAIALAVGGSAAASATPQRPQRHRTNPARANRALALQRMSAPAHGQPDAGSGSGCDFEFGDCFWWIGSISTDTSGVPNSGVRSTLSAVNYQPDAGCFDCWTSEFLDNGYWGQVGFSACSYPSASELNFTVFYQTWNADAGVLLVDGESTWASEGLHTFSMALDAGTVWDYAVDGTIFGSYDMGSASASGPNAISTVCEEGDGVPAAFVPPSIDVPATMQVESGGSWSGATSAWVYNTADLSGVVGNAQDSSLGNDATVIGGSSAFLAPGTTLWNGSGSGAMADAGATALTPVYLTVVSPAPNATVSGVVPIVADIDCPSQSTIYFWASDPNGPTCTLSPPLGASPYSCNWDSTQAPEGGLVDLTVQVEDPTGNLSWVDFSVTVDNSGSSGGSSSGGSAGSSGGVGSGSTSGGAASSGGGAGTTGGQGSSSGGSTAAGSSSSSSSSGGESSISSGGNGGTTGSAAKAKSNGCATGGGSSPGLLLPLLGLFAWIGRRQSVRPE